MQPIEIWREIINSKNTESEMHMRLEEIYRNNQPFIAEIIMNSHCSSRCLHCIYAPDYESYNKNMSWEEWKTAFQIIYEKLGLKRFIFDGRAITKECIQAIRLFKQDFPSAKVGLIADGISMEPFIEELIECPPNWLDISVDGLEKDHDTQRNYKGSYRKTIDTLIQLKESGAFERINILTCLTTLNIKSVTGMIRYLNARGFKNFFITPMSVLKGYRPDPDLQPDNEDFVQWLDELLETTKGLLDSWVEVDIYDALSAAAIRQFTPDLFKEFKTDYEHLEIKKTYRGNEFHISYYPASLTGIRELIVNSNGDIIPPKVMAMGNIPRDLITGRIFNHSRNETFFDNANGKNVLAIFLEELLEEKRLLGL